jgi:hypothetical protein
MIQKIEPVAGTRPQRRRLRERGPSPLSGSTRQRLLASLLRWANAGDVAAAEALIRIGLSAERPAVTPDPSGN